jgi:hypothetical protein
MNMGKSNMTDKEEARTHARAVLSTIHARIGQDYHTLSTFQVEQLLKEADAAKYRKPRNANGSRARYFYQLMQRRATATQKDG